MQLNEYVKASFNESIKLKNDLLETLLPSIVEAGELMASTIKDGNKILSCGNGGSACDAQHFNAEIVNRFQIERDCLPGVALTADIAVLTAIANDYGYQDVFVRQIRALGKPGDLLLAISTSGESPSVIKAISQAHESGLRVIALTGKDGGQIPNVLTDSDIEIRVSSEVTARVQETHILVVHCLCGLIDRILFSS